MISGLEIFEASEIFGLSCLLLGVTLVAKFILSLFFWHSCTDSLTLKAIFYKSSSCMIAYLLGLLPNLAGGFAAIYIITIRMRQIWIIQLQ